MSCQNRQGTTKIKIIHTNQPTIKSPNLDNATDDRCPEITVAWQDPVDHPKNAFPSSWLPFEQDSLGLLNIHLTLP